MIAGICLSAVGLCQLKRCGPTMCNICTQLVCQCLFSDVSSGVIWCIVCCRKWVEWLS